MTTSIRRGALACALLASSSLASPALAATSPAFRNLDANGVDMVQGDFLTSFSEGSIGSGKAQLELLRLVGNLGNTGLTGSSQWDRMLLYRNSGGVYIDWGSRSDKFPGAEARGATLTGSGNSYTYRAPDGTVVNFGDPNAGSSDITNFCDASGTQSACILVPTSLASPDGTTVTLSYGFWTRCTRQQNIDDPINCTFTPRLASVSNNFGYSIGFAYASGAGGSQSNPPATFQQRTGAAFYNPAVSSSPQATASYAYPVSGTTDVTDIGGRIWRVTSTTTNYAIRRPGAASNTTSANVSADIVSSVTKEGVTTSYSRSVSGSTVTETATDPLSHSTVVVSNLNVGRPSSITDPNGRTTSYLYDANARPTRITAPENNYVQYTYDTRGNVTQTDRVAKPGSGLLPITTSANFDPSCTNPVKCNQPNYTTDERNHVTNYEYDPTHGGVTKITAPPPVDVVGAIRPETRFSYTLLNGEYQLTGISACQTGSAPSCIGTADEVKTTIAYDAVGNITGVSSGAGDGSLTATTASTYDAIGNLLTQDGPLAGTADTIRYRYNAARQTIGTISPDPDGAGSLKNRAVRNTYNNGLLTKVEQGTVNSQSDGDWAAFAALQSEDIGYDANARLVTDAIVAAGTTYALTQTSYDAIGRPECRAVRMNPAAFGSLPASACTLGTSGSFGPDRIGKTIYDAAGQVTQIKAALGTSDEANEATTTYRQNGQVETLTDGENNKTTYVYDGHDRLLQTQFPSATKGAGTSNSGDYEQLGYDAASNVTSRRTRDNQMIYFGYDNLNRPISKDLPNTIAGEFDTTYAYDNLGRLTNANDTNGVYLSFAFDALGRRLSEGDNHHGYRTSQYDIAGRRTRLTWKDGFFVGYDYLATGEMSAIRENGATSGVGVLATFGYDDLGRRTSLTRGNGTVTSYAYDAVSRLASLGQDLAGTTYDLSLTFGYNPASQIVSNSRSNDTYAWVGHGSGSTTATANGLNQLASVGGTGITYDLRGNVTSDGVHSFAYTAENRLRNVDGAAFMAFNAIGKPFYIGNPQLSLTHDDDNLAEEVQYVAGYPILRRYVFGPGVDEPLVWYEGSGTSDRRWLHADERGSIVAVSDSSGNAIGVNRYDEYGAPQSGNIGRFQYTGQAWLPAAGLYDYKARMYHPKLGRFMQTDPIGYGAGMNLYGYVGGDPVNFTDPNGMGCRPAAYYSNFEGIQPSNRLICDADFGSFGYGARRGGGARQFQPRMLADGDGGSDANENQPQEEQQKISPCMRKFLASKGLNGPNLGSVVFHKGDGGSLIAKAAFAHGNPAITIQNNVYVAPGHWNSFRPGTAGFFEETVHSMQWAQSGTGNFISAWLIGSAAGALFTGDAHNSPLEAQAMGLSMDLAKAYREAGPRCEN